MQVGVLVQMKVPVRTTMVATLSRDSVSQVEAGEQTKEPRK